MRTFCDHGIEHTFESWAPTGRCNENRSDVKTSSGYGYGYTHTHTHTHTHAHTHTHTHTHTQLTSKTLEVDTSHRAQAAAGLRARL